MDTNTYISFFGAAGTVTGSRHLIETHGKKILIDCGLFQGLRELRDLNWKPFPVKPSEIDAVILTHAHLDHTGYLPLLGKNGFKGPVYLTPPTFDLATIILNDSAHIQVEEAEKANKEGYGKHKPALPLYKPEDVKRILPLFKRIALNTPTELFPGFEFTYRMAGHILGACFVEINCFGKRIVFSGDLGRPDSLTLFPPDKLSECDYLILESTYGNRDHEPTHPMDELAREIREAHERGGNLIIPSFAVGRTQELILMINRLKEENKIPSIPVVLDSPMGADATEAFCNYPAWHRLSVAESEHLCSHVFITRSIRDTHKVLDTPDSKIVIAGSGMLTGGRILYYLEKYLPEKSNTVLLVGYQAEGTRGWRLQNGEPEIKVWGNYIKVKARINQITTLSAHAGKSELVAWAGGSKKVPRKIFLVHGEPEAAKALKKTLEEKMETEVVIPGLNQRELMG